MSFVVTLSEKHDYPLFDSELIILTVLSEDIGVGGRKARVQGDLLGEL